MLRHLALLSGTMLLATLALACTPAAGTPVTTPTASASPTASSFAAATASPSATPGRTPLPVADVRPADLIVRIDLQGPGGPDAANDGPPVALVVVTADGRVVTAIAGGGVIGFTERRLTSAGAQRVRNEVIASGLFDRDHLIEVSQNGHDVTYPWIEPVPGTTPPPGVLSAHMFRVWNGTRTARVEQAIIGREREPYFRPTAQYARAAELAKRLLALEQSLPSDAWAASTAQPYAPTAFRLLVVRTDVIGSPPDADTVDWPFATPPANFGAPSPGLITGGGDIRCGTLTADDVRVVRDALVRAGATINEMSDDGMFQSYLASKTGPGILLWAQPLLPDQSSCA